MYTARGSQGFGTYDKITTFGVEPSDYDDVVLLKVTFDTVTAAYKARPLFTTKSKPDFLTSSDTGAATPYGLV